MSLGRARNRTAQSRRRAHQPLTTAPPSLFMKALKPIFVYFLICRSRFNFRRQIFAPGSRIQCRRTWVTSEETMTHKCTYLSKYYHVRVTIATGFRVAGHQLRFGLRTCSRSLTSIWKYCLRCHGEFIDRRRYSRSLINSSQQAAKVDWI